MRILSIWIIFYASHGIIGTLGSSSVDCNYDNAIFWAVGIKYRCFVSNDLNISSPESAIIDAVIGTHESGKTNNNEIYFFASRKHIEYFPRGLEKFFTNINGIEISYSQLKEIHQKDLKPYIKLKYLQLSYNNIEVIDDGLFDFQPDIEVIIFERSKIFHISSTVFDNLSKLTTLYLKGNNCIDMESTNNRTGVLDVIKSVKSNCTSPDYIKLDEKLKNLENNYKNMNHRYNARHIENIRSLEAELASSKFYNFQSLKERIFQISGWRKLLDLSDKSQVIEVKIEAQNKQINRIEQMLSDIIKAQNSTVNAATEKQRIQNPWMIIATAVVGFTQTIIFAVILMQFLA